MVAVIFMLGFLAGLGLRMVGGHRTTLYTGPDHMISSTDFVYVHANGNLFVLTHNGDTVQHLGPDQMQFAGLVIDLRMMPDGQLLIAERKPARIRLCDTTTWDCRPIKPTLEDTFSNWFKVLPSPDGQALYITDSTKGGALYGADLASGELKPILEDTLSSANDLQWAEPGVAWVADSGHRRILQLVIEGDTARETGFPFPTKNTASFENRTWPMMLQPLDGGEWAVTQPTSTGGRADILIYKDADTPEVRVPLADLLDPTDLALANGWLLVSDIEGFDLFTVDHTTGEHQPWGGERIRGWLRQQQDQRDTYQDWVDGGLVLMILCAPFMLVAGYYGTARAKRKQALGNMVGGNLKMEASDADSPAVAQTYWLKRNPKMERLFKWMLPLVIFCLVGIAAAMAYLFVNASDRLPVEKLAEMKQVLMLTIGFTVGIVLLFYFNLNVVRGQLGSDGQRIYVRYPNGDQGSAPASQIVYTNNLLHFGRHSVSIGANKKQALYQEGEIETWIAPLLKHGRKVNALSFFVRQVANGEIGPIYTALFVLVSGAAAIYLEFFTKSLP